MQLLARRHGSRAAEAGCLRSAQLKKEKLSIFDFVTLLCKLRAFKDVCYEEELYSHTVWETSYVT